MTNPFISVLEKTALPRAKKTPRGRLKRWTETESPAD